MTAFPETSAPTQKQSPPKKRHLTFFGVLGELFITVGVLLLLFVGWQLWWTDILGERAYDEERDSLAQEWGADNGPHEPLKPVKPKYGEAFGLAYIPAIRDGVWKVPIIEGTSPEELQRGIGHHTNGAVPGEIGNLTLAGHRTTYGAPLGDIDKLKSGDRVFVETKFGWYIYELDEKEIIKPWDGWILDPVPGAPSRVKPTEALLTIYSCNPKYSAAERFVWFGHLVSERPKSEGKPAALRKARGA